MSADRTRTSMRRAAVLLLLVAGLVVGSSLPSWAMFSDSSSVQANLTARTRCTGSDAAVTLTWGASTAPRVSGYRIRVHFGGGAYQDQTTVAATATTWTGTTPLIYVNNYTLTFTVWTLTQYGWTKESAPTARIVC